MVKRIGILAIDRLAELRLVGRQSVRRHGRARAGSPAGRAAIRRLPATRMLRVTLRHSSALLGDANGDAVLVMSVRTAWRRPGASPKPWHGVSVTAVPKRCSRPLVLAAWAGTDKRTECDLQAAGIPHFPTEDDAVRALSGAVCARSVSRACLLNVVSTFTPSTAAAKRVIHAGVIGGTPMARSVRKSSRCSKRTVFRLCPRSLPAMPACREQRHRFWQRELAVTVKLFSRDITEVGYRWRHLNFADTASPRRRAVLACPETLVGCQPCGATIQPMVRRAARER